MGGSFFFARRGRGIRGDTEIRRGTLERVPRTPQNFSERIIIAVTQRSCPLPRASPPIEHYLPAHLRCRPGTAAGGRGAKPPAKLTYGLPLPRRGRGSGGWGQKIKLKAGIAGDQKGKPPLPPCPPKKPPPWLTCTETQPRIVHPVQPAERNAKKIRKLFGKPVDKPRKECYNGNATGA